MLILHEDGNEKMITIWKIYFLGLKDDQGKTVLYSNLKDYMRIG